MTTETENELANVVMFIIKEADPIQDAGNIYERAKNCRHPGMHVNTQERQCWCQECGAVLDLLSAAKSETTFAGTIETQVVIERNAKDRTRGAERAKKD